MGTISFTDDLRAEYDRLYAEAEIPEDKKPVVEAAAQKILASWPRYETVAASLGIPPHLIALIHAMESGCNFERHLHNGDPLAARTVHVPAGRPATGEPPYTWEASAMDALRLHKLDQWQDWSISGLCYVLERYNGWGYRRYHPNVKSPYLWSFTSIYTAGKYVADGKWNESAVSQQVGAMALLMEIIKQGHLYPVEVVHAQDQGLAATPTESTAPILPPQRLQDEQGPSHSVGQAVATPVQVPRTLTIGGIRLSKKLTVAIGALLLIALNTPLHLGLSYSETVEMVKIVGAYLVGQSGVDAFGPLFAKLIKGDDHA